MDKIIFLDFDGVLNSVRTMHAFEVDRTLDDDYFTCLLISLVDPVAIALLNKITDETGAKIVVSSTNRLHLKFEGCVKVLRRMGATGEVVGVTEHLNSTRGIEIQEWVARNNVDTFVIIDDDRDMLTEQSANFVHVNGQIGLDHRNKDDAIKILNGTEPSMIVVVKDKE